MYVCEICGEAARDVYRDEVDSVIGCPSCVRHEDFSGVCPECGEDFTDCDVNIYKDLYGNVVGCESCAELSENEYFEERRA